MSSRLEMPSVIQHWSVFSYFVLYRSNKKVHTANCRLSCPWMWVFYESNVSTGTLSQVSLLYWIGSACTQSQHCPLRLGHLYFFILLILEDRTRSGFSFIPHGAQLTRHHRNSCCERIVFSVDLDCYLSFTNCHQILWLCPIVLAI